MKAIQRDLNKLENLKLVEKDILSLLEFDGQRMVGRIQDVINVEYCQKFTNEWGIPSHLARAPIALKAYDFLLPLCDQWINKLLVEHEAIKMKIIF